MRRTPLKRKAPKPGPSYEHFWRVVTNDGLARCALWRVGGPCVGPMDAHHYVPKRRLRTDAAKTDVRNGVCLCRRHHDQVESGRLESPRPRELAFFLHDHNVYERPRHEP